MRSKMIKRLCQTGIMVFAALFFVALFRYGSIQAAGSVAVTEINYDKSTITVQMGSGDTALLISDDKQKKWETVTIEPVNGFITMDISWITLAKDYVLSLKGDASTTPIKVTIPKQNKTFKATYSPLTGLSFTGVSEGTKIQWKKKEGITWMSFPDNPADFQNTLVGMIAKGCSVMFRTAPVNGNGTSAGQRPSKEVSLTIKARSAAPTVEINDSKMTISLKKNMEYRYCDENGNVQEGTQWTGVDSDEQRKLSSIAGSAMADGSNAGKNVYIQFRLTATAKTQVSNITTVTIPGQVPLTEEEKNGIELVYTSPSSFELKIASAKEKEPYEYYILSAKDVSEGYTIESIKDLTWTTISDNKAVIITKSKAADESQVYVRKKAKGKQGSDDYALPSPEYLKATVIYPKEPSTLEDELIWIQGIAGMCRPDNSAGHMTFHAYSSIESPITSVKLVPKTSSSTSSNSSSASVELSASEFTSTVRSLTENEINELPEEKKDYKYLVTTVITDASKLEKQIADREIKEFYIYYKQGSAAEYVESNESKGGLAARIYPKTIVSNPEGDAQITEMESHKTEPNKIKGDMGEYLTQFTRVYNSKWLYQTFYDDANKCDPNVFSFVLDIGSKFAPKDSSSEVSDTPTTVTKLVYDGVELASGNVAPGNKPYFVLNNVDYEDNGVAKRKIIVTVDTNAMEKNAQIKPKGELLGLSIYLNNGEVIKDDIKISFVKTGVVVEDETKTEASNQTITIIGKIDTASSQSTGENGTTTVNNDVYETVILYLNPSGTSGEVELDRVTYDGRDVCKGIKKTNNYIKVELSRSLLANIVNGYNSKTSKYLFFYFSNGYILTDGYKIIINP